MCEIRRCRHCNIHIIRTGIGWLSYVLREVACPYGPNGQHAPGNWQEELR